MLRLSTIFAALLLYTPAAAEGLIQLTLEGSLSASSGGRIELELELETPERPVVLELGLFLAPGTAAPTVAELIHQELIAAGARSIFSAAEREVVGVPRADVFVARTTRIALRLGEGLQGSITLCQGPPLSVLIEPAGSSPAAANLIVQASTWLLHSRTRGASRLEFAIPAGAHPAQIAADLFRSAHAAGWSCERPEDKVWQPVKMSDGAVISGTTFRLVSQGDWLLELVL